MSPKRAGDTQIRTARRKPRLGRQWQAMALEDLAWIEGLALHWPAAQRSRWALWLNVLVPGAGLIALQREKTGVPLAGAFVLCTEIALLGLLFVPQTLGAPLTTVAVGAAATAWLASQVLLLRRLRDLQDLEVRIQVSTMIEQAREAVMADEWVAAGQLLEEASEYDPEQLELNWLLAKVYSAIGSADQAARQWRRLQQVDRAGRYETDVQQALAGRPPVGRTRRA